MTDEGELAFSARIVEVEGKVGSDRDRQPRARDGARFRFKFSSGRPAPSTRLAFSALATTSADDLDDPATIAVKTHDPACLRVISESSAL